MAERGGGPADLLVIFGVTGDLARKMTFRALYRLERRKALDCPILGVASDDTSVEELVKRAHKAISEAGEKIDDKVFDRLAGRLSYLHGDVTDSELYTSLAERIGSGRNPLYYLEMPPALFAPIVENLAKAGLLERSRVAVEKPFGHDLASAIELNARLRAVLRAGLTGDHQLFAREDSIEQTWRIVQPLLDNPGEVHAYERGSWGPEAAQSLVRGHHGWQRPWLPGNKHA